MAQLAVSPTQVLDQPAAPQRSARRQLQLALGVVWLLDAVLQFQPYMFTRQFVSGTILPAAVGDPALVTRPIEWAAQLMAAHIAVWNTLFALIQLAIAAGFFHRRAVRLALAASIAWSVFVWLFGEGLGGILTGASPLAGLPGAVVIYALIAVLLWPAGQERPGTAARLGWMALWAALGCYQLLPANRAPSAVSATFAMSAAGEPAWLRPVGAGLAGLLAGHGLAASVLIWAACCAAGLGIASARLTRPALVLAGLLGLLFWVAEGFGGIATGQATDPNSGPLLILLAFCYWPGLLADAVV